MIPEHLQPFTTPIRVLDQGFVRLVDVMGDDGSVVTAARVSTGKGRSQHVWIDAPSWNRDGRMVCKVCNEGRVYVHEHDEWATDGVCIEGDQRLIRYMTEHAHGTPFEFATATFHVRVPMDVWRQWVRHRTFAINEYSTRYSDAIDATAATPPDAWRAQATANRQGSSGFVTEWPEGYAGGEGRPLPEGAASAGEYLSNRERLLHEHAREVYEERLAFGVAREQARKDLPLSTYTEAYWTGNLRNLLHFLSLRMDAHAQLEIRAYANVIGEIVSAWCPLTWIAFCEFNPLRDAVTLSATQARILRQALAGRVDVAETIADSTLNQRQVSALLTKLGLVSK